MDLVAQWVGWPPAAVGSWVQALAAPFPIQFPANTSWEQAATEGREPEPLAAVDIQGVNLVGGRHQDPKPYRVILRQNPLTAFAPSVLCQKEFTDLK